MNQKKDLAGQRVSVYITDNDFNDNINKIKIYFLINEKVDKSRSAIISEAVKYMAEHIK